MITKINSSADGTLCCPGCGMKLKVTRVIRNKKATDFLREILHNGPVSQIRIVEDGIQRGLSKKMIRSAKTSLEVVSTKTGFGPGGGWEWSLPPIES